MKKRTKSQFSMYDRPQMASSTPCFYSNQYEFGQLHTARLQSNQGYQRPVDGNHVRDIIRNFDPLYLDEILVSARDGGYFVIDGQNRIAAFKEMNGGRDCMVNCKIYHGLTYEQEAEMFQHLDSIKKKLRFCDTVRAKAEAKSDPVINGINQVFDVYGLHWSYSGTSAGGDHTVTASKALTESYKELGPAMFESMVRLLAYTWRGKRDSLTEPFIKGLSLFVKTYARDGDEATFIRKVGKHTPSEIKSLAISQGGSSAAVKYARVFLEKYNFKATSSTRLPYRLE